MAYRQKGEKQLLEDEVVARARFEVSLAVRRLIDEVVPELQAHFNALINSGTKSSITDVSHEEVQAKLREVLLDRLGGKETRRVLPAAKR